MQNHNLSEDIEMTDVREEESNNGNSTSHKQNITKLGRKAARKTTKNTISENLLNGDMSIICEGDLDKNSSPREETPFINMESSYFDNIRSDQFTTRKKREISPDVECYDPTMNPEAREKTNRQMQPTTPKDISTPKSLLQKGDFEKYLVKNANIYDVANIMRYMLYPKKRLLANITLVSTEKIQKNSKFCRSPYPYYFDSFVHMASLYIPFRDGTFLYRRYVTPNNLKPYWYYYCINAENSGTFILCQFRARFYPLTGQFIPQGRHHSMCYSWQINFVSFDHRSRKIIQDMTFKEYIDGYGQMLITQREMQLDILYEKTVEENKTYNILPFHADPINIKYSQALHDKHDSVYVETSECNKNPLKKSDLLTPNPTYFFESDNISLDSPEVKLEKLASAVLMNDFQTMYKIATYVIDTKDLFCKLYSRHVPHLIFPKKVPKIFRKQMRSIKNRETYGFNTRYRDHKKRWKNNRSSMINNKPRHFTPVTYTSSNDVQKSATHESDPDLSEEDNNKEESFISHNYSNLNLNKVNNTRANKRKRSNSMNNQDFNNGKRIK